jgi:hypothetical protein
MVEDSQPLGNDWFARLTPARALPPFLQDVLIEVSSVPTTLEGATRSGVLWQAAPGRLLLEVPEVARYLVENGRRMMVQPLPGAHPGRVEEFLRTAPLAALLYQRGVLAFHAAAAARDGECVLITGASCVGKSTLLAALLNRGWDMLADDLTVVETDDQGEPIVLPTFPEISLWPDAAAKLEWPGSLGAEDGARAADRGPYLERVTLRQRSFAAGPAPLRVLYWLWADNSQEVELRGVAEGWDPSLALASLTYNPLIAEVLTDRESYARLATRVLRSVPIRELRRPRLAWRVEELADAIERSASEFLAGPSGDPP